MCVREKLQIRDTRIFPSPNKNPKRNTNVPKTRSRASPGRKIQVGEVVGKRTWGVKWRSFLKIPREQDDVWSDARSDKLEGLCESIGCRFCLERWFQVERGVGEQGGHPGPDFRGSIFQPLREDVIWKTYWVSAVLLAISLLGYWMLRDKITVTLIRSNKLTDWCNEDNDDDSVSGKGISPPRRS